MRNGWIICPRRSGSISSVKPISKGLYCMQAVKIFNALKLTTEFSGSDCGFLVVLLFFFFSDKNHFGEESSETECESICFLHFIAAPEFKCRLLNTSLPGNSGK